MKKVLLIFTLVLLVAGCSKRNNPLLGNWALVSCTTEQGMSVMTDIKTWYFNDENIVLINGTIVKNYVVYDQVITMISLDKSSRIQYDLESIDGSTLKVAQPNLHYTFSKIK